MKKSTDKDELKNLLVQNRRKEKIKKEHVNVKWIVKIIIMAFTISFGLSFISEMTIPKLSTIFGILITLLFIAIGILFDIIGVAVTTADEKVFHSMNSRKVKGADIAVRFIKNNEKVSSFCCDVIGDICGVLSGAISAMLAVRIATVLHININMNFLIGAVVAAVTVGSKAAGKVIGQEHSTEIVHIVGKMMNRFIK